MRIIFVTGPAYSGKTIFIGQNYPGARLIDVKTYYNNIYGAEDNDQIQNIHDTAQIYCKEALKNQIRLSGPDDILVFEHPMLQKDLRKYYLDAVREVTDTPVELVVMCPLDEDLKKMFGNMDQAYQLYKYERDMLEMPDVSEGFHAVSQIRPVFYY